jgi:hypothetical protein
MEKPGDLMRQLEKGHHTFCRTAVRNEAMISWAKEVSFPGGKELEI